MKKKSLVSTERKANVKLAFNEPIIKEQNFEAIKIANN
jgi:hypothetical protein